MATISKLQVELSLIDKMSTGLKTVGSNLDAIGERATRAGQKLTAGLTLPLVGIGIVGVKAASDLNEAISATTVVFGDNAEEVLKWSQSSARAFGLSQQQALTAANQFGALGKSVGLTNDEAVKFSQSIVQAAADLGSFFNVDPGTVLQDIQSGLAGQSEPLRKYNIYLTEAAVAAEAMRLGLVGANGEITEGAKVQARYSLIMQSLGPAQGDFARTSGEAANQMRIATAESTNAAAVLGTQLLPAIVKVSGAITNMSTGFQNLSPQMQKVVTALGVIAAVIGPLALAIGFVISNLLAFQISLGLIVAPIGAVFSVLATLVAFMYGPFILAFVLVKKNVFGLGDAFTTVKNVITQAITAVTRVIQTFADGVTNIMRTLKTVFSADWNTIKSVVTKAATDTKTAVMGTLSDFLAGTKAYLAIFLTVFTTAWKDIYTAVQIQMISIKEKVGGVLNEIGGSVFGKAWSIGYNIGSGLISGIDAIWGAVVSKASGLAQAALDALGAVARILSPSKVTTYYGKMLGEGLVTGMKQAEGAVALAASSLASAALPNPMTASYGAMGTGGYGLGSGVTVHGGIRITVEGSSDPDATADAVFTKFARELSLHGGG